MHNTSLLLPGSSLDSSCFIDIVCCAERNKCILIFQCFTEISTKLNLNIKIVFIALRDVFNLKLVFVIFLPQEWSLVSFDESYNLPWNQFGLSAHWVHTTSFSMSWTKVFVEAKFQEMLLLLSGLIPSRGSQKVVLK